MSIIKSVVISCAGIGSRLGSGTPKSLLDINGRTLISRQLDYFRTVENIRIVLGFRANDIINEVLKYRNDVVFVFNHEYFETKTGASFYVGAQYAGDYVLEWDGDLIVHPDDVDSILNTEGEFICYSDITSDEAVFVQTDKDGNVLAFSRESGDYEWTGPACISKSRLKPSNQNVYNMFEPNLPMKGMKIRAYDIDTQYDLERVSNIVKSWEV
ncbi:MAG: NTP transferase domain-containing protein [Bacteroidales bacterium]|nr:NTP transferase domain-containing protein [Bacteroidales bacterium]